MEAPSIESAMAPKLRLKVTAPSCVLVPTITLDLPTRTAWCRQDMTGLIDMVEAPHLSVSFVERSAHHELEQRIAFLV